MTIPFINLKTQYQQNKTDIDAAISNVLEHGQYVMGPEVHELEAQLADYIGVKHVLSCSSGTDALLLPLMAKQLSSDDVIFTTPFTFFATAEAITLAGATPVFVDINPDTYNIDPQQLELQIQRIIAEGKQSPAGIMPVDLFGLAADYDVINAIAQKYNLFVLEDAAQAFGANYKGKKACGLADIAATSFFPAKPLGCYGDGGAVFTNDTELHERLISLRVHGQGKTGDKYDNINIGLNARMDTIQAAILLEKLKLYDDEIIRRSQVAQHYNEALAGIVKTPHTPDNQGSVWAQYSIQVENRQTIRDALQQQGIPTAVYYPIPIHLSTAYQHLNHKPGDFPISEAASGKIMSLPMHPYLQEDTINLITNTIKNAI